MHLEKQPLGKKNIASSKRALPKNASTEQIKMSQPVGKYYSNETQFEYPYRLLLITCFNIIFILIISKVRKLKIKASIEFRIVSIKYHRWR